MRSFTQNTQSGYNSEQDLPVGGFIIALYLAFVGHQGTIEVVAEEKENFYIYAPDGVYRDFSTFQIDQEL